MKIIFEGTIFFVFYFFKVEIGGRWWNVGTFLIIPAYISR